MTKNQANLVAALAAISFTHRVDEQVSADALTDQSTEITGYSTAADGTISFYTQWTDIVLKPDGSVCVEDANFTYLTAATELREEVRVATSRW